MPIVTRTLESVQPTTGGVFANLLAVDALGREWRRSRSRFVDEVAAEVASDAHDWTPQLRAQDFRELLVWVQELNPVSTFDLTGRDITEDDGEEFIMKWFGESDGGDAITVAWWLDDINTGKFNSIRDRVGYTGVEGSTITQRFTFLLSAEPWWDVIVKAPS